MKTKNIVVVGGGTAGWLTALLAREFYPTYDITLVESETIGVLGAGEGTVAQITHILDKLRIPVSVLVKECNATIKTGIRFINWHGENSSYYHHFISNFDLEHKVADEYGFNNMIYTYMIANNIPLDNVNFMKQLSDQNKVPFLKKNEKDYNYQDPMLSLNKLGGYALHFDARLLAKFFSTVAQQQRNVTRIEGKFQSAIQDESGNITAIKLDGERTIFCDFIFDCSGFARLILGGVFNEEWKSYKEHLPADTAVPFFIPHEGNDIAPETKAIAMKYGWMWKIPVQNRYGCGYVFNSDYINNEQALQEIEEYVGHSVISPKTFKFNAGSHKRALVKNCLAVGLAHGFIEPLEATSIWAASINLMNFLRSDALNNNTPLTAKILNERYEQLDNEILDFIYLHYLTERTDTDFWRNFRSNTKMPATLQERLNKWNNIPMIDHDMMGPFNYFADGWIIVGDGCRLFNRQQFKNISDRFNYKERIESKYQTLIDLQCQVTDECMTHREFIEYMQYYPSVVLN